MNIDATFWVAVSFFIFIGGLIYLKVPTKINEMLETKLNEIKNEVDNAEKLKDESKNLLNEYENKLNEASKEVQNIISVAKKENEKNIVANTEKFYQLIESRKKTANEKIQQMKNESIKDIKNASVKIAIESVANLLKNSIDKSKLEPLFEESLKEAKNTIKKSTI